MKLQEPFLGVLVGETTFYPGDTPAESYRSSLTCMYTRTNHVTSCCDDNGLDVPQEYVCTWCGRKTHRLDLDFEVPMHLECSGLRVTRMLMPHRMVARALLGLLFSLTAFIFHSRSDLGSR